MLFINANYWVSHCANKIWLNCLQLELRNRITIQKSNRETVYHVISTFESNLTQSWRHNSAHLLSGLDLLCPAALHPFLSDLGFLPCFPHKLLACTRNYYIQSATILGIALNVIVCIFFFCNIHTRDKICQTEGWMNMWNILKQTANNHKSLVHLLKVYSSTCA